MSKKPTIKKPSSETSPVTEATLRLADEDVEEVIPLLVDEEHVVTTNEDEDFGVELVKMISETTPDDETSVNQNLFQNDVLVDRVEHDKDQELGKSFRSKDLTQEDLTEREVMPTLEDQWHQENVSSPGGSWMNRLMILGLLLLITAGAWAFLNLDKEGIVKEERDRELKKSALISEKYDAEYEQKNTRIQNCIRGYLEATTIEERAKWCRNPEETLRKMTEYYVNRLTFDTYHFDSVSMTTEMDIANKEVILTASKTRSFSGEMSEEEKPKSLLLEKQEDGTYLVDWETAVIFQPSDWDEFVATRNTKAHVFRIDLKDRNNYGPYLYQYSDDNRYQAYRVNIRGIEDKYLIAYAEKDSEIDKKLKKLVTPSREKGAKTKITVPMTLKLAFPPNAESDQCVEIIEILSESWFLP